MAEIIELEAGEEPADRENFVLIQAIQTAEGEMEYRVRAEGRSKDGPVSLTHTFESLRLAQEAAERIVGAWRSRPPIYMRPALEH